MRERLEVMKIVALEAARKANTAEELQQVRHQYLGRKGELTLILKELGKLETETRRQIACRGECFISRFITDREEALADEGSVIQGRST